MDNHFHVVVHVPKPEEEITVDEVLRRIGILKGEVEAEVLRKRWAGLDKGVLEARLDGWRRRMQNLHEFVKTFKELVNIACKNDTKHTGTLFEGRYHSTLIEDGTYLAACIRYVEYNPIRAGIVRRAADYRWSTKNATKANEISLHVGSVPEEGGWLLKRVAQMSQGQVFGSAAFVRKMVLSFGACFAAKAVGVRPVVDGEGVLVPIDACATHGHRLAKAA